MRKLHQRIFKSSFSATQNVVQGPRAGRDWLKCRFLGPAQVLWSRISILTRSSCDCIHLKVWQALLSGTGKDKIRNYKSGPKCEGISGIRRLDDVWGRNKRVNCNSEELKGGFLQHELWLEKKKKAEQSLATFGL